MERIISRGVRKPALDLSDPWGNGCQCGDESGGTTLLLNESEEVLAAFAAAQAPRCQAGGLRIRAGASVPSQPWGRHIEGVGDESGGSGLIALVARIRR
jgi:hypothetical protein